MTHTEVGRRAFHGALNDTKGSEFVVHLPIAAGHSQ